MLNMAIEVFVVWQNCNRLPQYNCCRHCSVNSVEADIVDMFRTTSCARSVPGCQCSYRVEHGSHRRASHRHELTNHTQNITLLIYKSFTHTHVVRSSKYIIKVHCPGHDVILPGGLPPNKCASKLDVEGHRSVKVCHSSPDARIW